MSIVARTSEARVRPAYTATKLEGTRTRSVHAFDAKRRKIVKKDIEVPAGYFVKFAKGHSNVLSAEEFERLQQMTPEYTVIDMETGIDVTGKV